MIVIFHDSIIYSIQRVGGISIYWQNIQNGLRKNKDYHLLSICYKKKSILDIESETRSHFLFKILNEKICLHLLKFMTVNSPKNEEPDIFHSSYYRLPSKDFSGKIVTTIHDFIPEKYYPKIKQIILGFHRKRVFQCSDLIICVSETTKNDFHKYYPNIYNNKKVVVIPHGCKFHEGYVPIPKSGKSKELLYVGDRKAEYKNFFRLVYLLKKLKGYKLKIVGQKLSNREISILSENLGGNWGFEENPSNNRLLEIYQKSFALLYPSSYEGFGIPIIESMSNGTPVILNKIEVFKEFFSEAGLFNYFDNFTTFQKTLKELELNYDSFQDKGMKLARKFSLEKSTQQTLEAYKNLIQS